MKYRVIGLAWLILLMSCTEADNPIAERASKAEKTRGDIIIGAAAPWTTLKDMLWQGIEMAVEEINGTGGVLGRKIHIIKEDDEGSVDKGQIIAQSFTKNKDMVAVIGHYNSYISIPTSIIYEYYGLLMLSPISTSPKLTRQGFRRVFRNIPDDEAIGKELANFCLKQGYRQMMVYHVSDEYGEGLANAFEKQSEEIGITILDRYAYDSTSGPINFEKDLSYWKENFNFDAIFLAGLVPLAAQFIAEARKLKITVPIIGGDGLDSPELLQIANRAADGTFVGTAFHLDDPREEVQVFVEAFRKKYSVLPDAGAAALGYDAVKVLAYAMKKAGTTVPDKVADALRSIKAWPGVTGLHTFDAKGDVVKKDICIKVVRNGRFRFVGTRQRTPHE